MLSLSQQIRAGIVLNSLYQKHAFVRRYVWLLLKIAPGKYKRLLKLKNTIGLLCVLAAICAIGLGN
jgi:hypothetical protein